MFWNQIFVGYHKWCHLLLCSGKVNAKHDAAIEGEGNSIGNLNAPDRKSNRLLMSYVFARRPTVCGDKYLAVSTKASREHNLSEGHCWANMVERKVRVWKRRCANRCVCFQTLGKSLAGTRGDWVRVVCCCSSSSRCLCSPGETQGKRIHTVEISSL